MEDATAPRGLIIENDEAVALAEKLARRTNATTADVVLTALRQYERGTPTANDRLPPEVIEENRRRLAEARRVLWGGEHPPEDRSSNHDWLYDENGLPA